jgi:hypothetical protein
MSKYRTWYAQLMKKAIDRNWSKKSAGCYVENHHIMPKSLGGSNSKHNLVYLTAREHYVAHLLLWKIYKKRMALAFFFMNNSGRYTDKFKKIGSASYKILREDASLKGKDNPKFGFKYSKETIKSMSDRQRVYMSNPQTRENLRQKRLNQVISVDSYKKQAKVMSSLVWMNDGVRSYRIKPELVQEKILDGLVHGRLINYVNESFKKLRSQIATNQWQAVKLAGHNGHLIRI